MNLKHMTDEELIKLNEELNNILKEKKIEKRKIAIENFRNAFEKLKEYTCEISVEDWDEIIYIDNFDQFHFGD